MLLWMKCCEKHSTRATLISTCAKVYCQVVQYYLLSEFIITTTIVRPSGISFIACAIFDLCRWSFYAVKSRNLLIAVDSVILFLIGFPSLSHIANYSSTSSHLLVCFADDSTLGSSGNYESELLRLNLKICSRE